MRFLLQGLQLHSFVIGMARRSGRVRPITNNYGASRAHRARGVKSTVDHAIFEVEYLDKVYIFNANDWNPQLARNYGGYTQTGIPLDGFERKVGDRYVRVLAAKPFFLESRGEGECAAFSVACSEFVYHPSQDTVPMADRINALAEVALTARNVREFVHLLM